MQNLPVDSFEWVKTTNFTEKFIKNCVILIAMSDICMKQTLNTAIIWDVA